MQEANHMEEIPIEAWPNNGLGDCFGRRNKNLQEEVNFIRGYHLSQYEQFVKARFQVKMRMIFLNALIILPSFSNNFIYLNVRQCRHRKPSHNTVTPKSAKHSVLA